MKQIYFMLLITVIGCYTGRTFTGDKLNEFQPTIPGSFTAVTLLSGEKVIFNNLGGQSMILDDIVVGYDKEQKLVAIPAILILHVEQNSLNPNEILEITTRDEKKIVFDSAGGKNLHNSSVVSGLTSEGTSIIIPMSEIRSAEIRQHDAGKTILLGTAISIGLVIVWVKFIWEGVNIGGIGGESP